MSKSNVNEDSDCVERCLGREASEVGNREEKVRDGSYVCGLTVLENGGVEISNCSVSWLMYKVYRITNQRSLLL